MMLLISVRQSGNMDSYPLIFSDFCNVCQTEKKGLDRNDDIIVSKDGSYFRGAWFCPHGHAKSDSESW
jgi:hypothetical protein